MITKGLGGELILSGLGGVASYSELVCCYTTLRNEIINLLCRIQIESKVVSSKTLYCQLLSLVEEYSIITSALIVNCFATKTLLNRLVIRKELLVSLISKTIVCKENINILGCSLSVNFGKSISNLVLNVRVLKVVVGKTPSGKPIRLQTKKYRLVTIENELSLIGSRINNLKGSINCKGSILSFRKGNLKINGNILNNINGELLFNGNSLNTIISSINVSGNRIISISDNLKFNGNYLNKIEGKLLLSGERDKIGVLLALGTMNNVFDLMEV